MARFAVLGFTEAELGFVLAALFVAVSGFQIVQATRAEDNAEASREETEALKDSLWVARAELDSLRRRTSRLTPYCSEKGETSELIASVLVTGRSTYEVDGRTMRIGDVRVHLSRWLEISSRKSCRFGIAVTPAPGVSGSDLMAAREPLGLLFYFR